MAFDAMFLDECRSQNGSSTGEDTAPQDEQSRENDQLRRLGHLALVFLASAMTASNASLGLLSPSKRRGRPCRRQETASFTPQKVIIFTEPRCFRNARKIPA